MKYGSSRSIGEILRRVPSFSAELGLDLNQRKDRFKWFIASLLLARRISATIAKKTFRRLMEEGLKDADSILEAGWDRLVETLDSGGYVRYNFSTATNLLETIRMLKSGYGDLEKLHEKADNPKDLELKLRKFRGFGPTAVNIFLRELRGIWLKADPNPSKKALETAELLGLKTRGVKKFKSSLIRKILSIAKNRDVGECPVKGYCRKPKFR